MWNVWLFFFSLMYIEPLSFERIEPIQLSNSCSSVYIIESNGLTLSTDNVKVIDQTCQLSVESFNRFLKTKNIYTQIPKISAVISFIPDGPGLRQLNDPFRFITGLIPVDKNGNIIKKYGYYHFNTKHIFLTNSISSLKFFKMLLAHELFHAMSFQTKIIKNFPKPYYDFDEKFAREFTDYLGLGQ